MSQAGQAGIDARGEFAIDTINSISPSGTGNFNINAGSNITITPGVNSISIATTAPAGIQTLNGDTGSATGSTVTVQASGSGSTVKFTGSGATLTLGVTDNVHSDIFIGNGAGNATVTGSDCTALGVNALHSVTSGNGNVGIGHNAGTAITTGFQNMCIGTESLSGIIGGTNNIAIGGSSGSFYTGSESSNILIGNQGILGESHVIHIGRSGSGAAQQNSCFIAGIFGNTIGSSQYVTVDTTGHLGSTAIPSTISTINGNSGSATGSTVTVQATNAGATVNFTGSGSTVTYTNTDIVKNNMFLGDNTGNITLSGTDNIGVGTNNLVALTSGEGNVGLGSGTLLALTSGVGNVAIGDGVLSSLISGNANLALGSNAGENYTGAEIYNILIGNGGTVGENSAIRIGTMGGGGPNQTSCYVAGISGVTVTGSAVLCSVTGKLGTVVSSERYKSNIQDMADASSSIYNLRPVTFTYKTELPKTEADAAAPIHYGLIAEEVAKVLPQLVINDLEGRPDSVKYHEMPAILLNEIQKLKLEIDGLKEAIAKLGA